MLPLIFLLLFGFGITLDAGILRLAVLDQSGGSRSLTLAADFAHSPWFETRPVGNMEQGARLMRDSDVLGILVIRQDFDQELARGGAGSLQLLVDGSEPNTAQFIQSYSQGLISNCNAPPCPAARPWSRPSIWKRVSGTIPRPRACSSWCREPLPSS